MGEIQNEVNSLIGQAAILTGINKVSKDVKEIANNKQDIKEINDKNLADAENEILAKRIVSKDRYVNNVGVGMPEDKIISKDKIISLFSKGQKKFEMKFKQTKNTDDENAENSLLRADSIIKSGNKQSKTVKKIKQTLFRKGRK